MVQFAHGRRIQTFVSSPDLKACSAEDMFPFFYAT